MIGEETFWVEKQRTTGRGHGGAAFVSGSRPGMWLDALGKPVLRLGAGARAQHAAASTVGENGNGAPSGDRTGPRSAGFDGVREVCLEGSREEDGCLRGRPLGARGADNGDDNDDNRGDHHANDG